MHSYGWERYYKKFLSKYQFHHQQDIYIFFNMLIIKTVSIYLFWINNKTSLPVRNVCRDEEREKKGETPASCEQNKASNSRFQGNSLTLRIKPYWICWSFSLYFPTFSLHLHFSSRASTFRGLASHVPRSADIVSYLEKNSGWRRLELCYLNFYLDCVKLHERHREY